MIELILSLLEAWCTVKVKTSSSKPRKLKTKSGFTIYKAQPGQVWTINSLDDLEYLQYEVAFERILQVYPPKRPEYKAGDKVMFWDDSSEKWLWPYEVALQWLHDRAWPYPYILVAGIARKLDEHIICPYHEWVQYNPQGDIVE